MPSNTGAFRSPVSSNEWSDRSLPGHWHRTRNAPVSPRPRALWPIRRGNRRHAGHGDLQIRRGTEAVLGYDLLEILRHSPAPPAMARCAAAGRAVRMSNITTDEVPTPMCTRSPSDQLRQDGAATLVDLGGHRARVELSVIRWCGCGRGQRPGTPGYRDTNTVSLPAPPAITVAGERSAPFPGLGCARPESRDRAVASSDGPRR